MVDGKSSECGPRCPSPGSVPPQPPETGSAALDAQPRANLAVPGAAADWGREEEKGIKTAALRWLEAELDHKIVLADSSPDRVEETLKRKLVASPVVSRAANAFIKRHGGGRAVPRNWDDKITEVMQIVRAA